MISKTHEQEIVAKLKAAGLKYQEVYEELLDHYAVAVEEKMKNQNLSFEEVLNCTHQEFGGSKEVKKIEKRYFEQMSRFYHQTQLKQLKQQLK